MCINGQQKCHFNSSCCYYNFNRYDFIYIIDIYKEVDSNYVFAPLPNEKVKFTGTYLGPYEGIYNFNNNSGVIDVGGSYAIVSTSKLHGLEGKTVTVKGYFVNDKAETKTVYINGRYVNGEIFCIEEVV